MMNLVDCRGKTCPEPVIETKRFLEEGSPRELQVVVDNQTSRENVRRFLESKGYDVQVEDRDEGIFLTAQKKEKEPPSTTQQEKKVVVFVTADSMGRGDDKLGAILMKSFLFSIKELKPLPWRMIFINGGVRLSCEGSECLDQVRELEEQGVEILSCGTCLDFFNLKEKLKTGRVSNMFEIVSSLTDATHVLKP